MIWHDLLFAHWPVDPSELSGLLPAGLELDTFEGHAWIGIVPFRMLIRPRRLPPIPGVSTFPELNVRTYVVAEAKPGVWFMTLDAPNRIAIRVARRFFHLPYCNARITCSTSKDGWIDYRSLRCDRRYPPAKFAAQYRPLPPADSMCDTGFQHDPLSNWLTARYCLYSADARGRIFRGEIDHAVWPLEPAEAIVEENTVASALGVALPDRRPPLLHFSRRMDVVAWTLDRVT